MPTVGARFSEGTKSSRAIPISRTISSSTSTSMVRMAAAVELRTKRAGLALSPTLSLNWPPDKESRVVPEPRWNKKNRARFRPDRSPPDPLQKRLASVAVAALRVSVRHDVQTGHQIERDGGRPENIGAASDR